jgi:CheY-like chemotaxis protein
MSLAKRANDPPHLLLVDDCAGVRDLYQLALEPTFQVLTASRGTDGIAIATSERPDVVVLDVVMPGLDGWETCAAIKSNPLTADIPVILLTGADDRDLTEHANAVGASALLNKPCPADRLLAAIRSALGEEIEPPTGPQPR